MQTYATVTLTDGVSITGYVAASEYMHRCAYRYNERRQCDSYTTDPVDAVVGWLCRAHQIETRMFSPMWNRL